MTRDEHLAWCKKRAHEYVARGDVANAVTSMLSDMDKHPETKLKPGGVLSALGMMTMMQNSIPDAKRFIDGFN